MDSSSRSRRTSCGNSLLIPASAIEQFTNCPICCSTFTNCYMTPCGHRFCEECIKRHLLINPRLCPCCKSAITESQLMKDHQFDAQIVVFETEKRLAQDRYFDEIFVSTTAPNCASGVYRFFSPIQEVLKDYLKLCFLSHESYHQDLKHRRDKAAALLDLECKRQIECVSQTCPERFNVIKTIERTFEERKEQLDKELKDNVDHIAKAFKDHLQRMPDLKTIPFKVTIAILCKDMMLPSVLLEPRANVEDVKAVVAKTVNGASQLWECDPIKEWSDDIRMVALGSFMAYDAAHLRQIAAEVVAGHFYEGACLIPPSTPLLNLGLKHISHILIHGKVMFESDQPQKCFAETFIDQNSKQDYFTCQTCGMANWICRSCKLICHAGHSVTPYVLGHNPGWPCCYCTKTKLCLLRRKT